MRPLIVAEPMLRAPKPEIEAELYGASSDRETVAQRNSAAGKISFKEDIMSTKELLGSGREMKNRVIDWHVGLGFINNNLLFVGVSLPAGFN
jgi:hypothetical protein